MKKIASELGKCALVVAGVLLSAASLANAQQQSRASSSSAVDVEAPQWPGSQASRRDVLRQLREIGGGCASDGASGPGQFADQVDAVVGPRNDANATTRLVHLALTERAMSRHTFGFILKSLAKRPSGISALARIERAADRLAARWLEQMKEDGDDYGGDDETMHRGLVDLILVMVVDAASDVPGEASSNLLRRLAAEGSSFVRGTATASLSRR